MSKQEANPPPSTITKSYLPYSASISSSITVCHTGIRTPDLLHAVPTLYHLSYLSCLYALGPQSVYWM